MELYLKAMVVMFDVSRIDIKPLMVKQCFEFIDSFVNLFDYCGFI